MNTDPESALAAADGPRGEDALEPVAIQAALTVSDRANGTPGDFCVIIRGTITSTQITDLGWDWYWRPPAERSPEPEPLAKKEPRR